MNAFWLLFLLIQVNGELTAYMNYYFSVSGKQMSSLPSERGK